MIDNRCYLLILSGGGDTTITVVDQTAWDYINGPAPKFPEGQYSAQETPPWHRDRLIATVTVTTGSWENDRALHASVETGKSFDTITEAMRYINGEKLELADEYHGCIY
jgi:hypothetical protein